MIKQRLEEMVIDTINQYQVDRSVLQCARGSQTTKASASDHHFASLVGHHCLTSRRGSFIG